MKKIVVNCSYCKQRIEIEVPIDIAKDREYYPFEYINIHGSPAHALMLFLDQSLSVRDTMVYEDLNVAKKQKEEFETIVRMSEIEAFASVYTDPLRLKILMILTNGPITEDALLEELQNEKDFQIQKFNLLILPLRKTGLVTTSYLYETFYECYFLKKDFIVERIPSKLNIEIISNNIKFKRYTNMYLNKVNNIFQDYQKKFLSDKNKQLEDIKYCLELLSTPKYEKILRILRNGPQTSKQLSSSVDIGPIQELIKNNIIIELEVKGEKYFTLLCDVKVKKFIPKYLLNAIPNKLKNKEISLEMATKHLDLLYESETK